MVTRHSSVADSNQKLIPAVGYARRSTDMQERSIPDQQAFVERWAGENGYQILRWYIDDAISGTSTRGREDFDRLIDAAENGRDFNTILCYDISRFSRGGTNETGYYIHRLKLAGVKVLFPADAIPDGDEGELIQGVKSWQARQYSIKLARDTIRGMVSYVTQRHGVPGGIAPYGYDKQHVTADGKVLRTLRWLPDGSKQEFGIDGKLLRIIPPGESLKKAKSDIIRFVPSTPDRVAVIKRMFDLCVQGYGYSYIAGLFNKEGIPAPCGGPWNMSRIGKLIRNPAYRGAVAWNRHTMGSLFGLDREGRLRPKQKAGVRRNDESDWIVTENAHKPLVKPEIWAAAQKAVAKRRKEFGKARSTNRSLLGTLLTCKRCNYSFTSDRINRRQSPNGEGYRYYTCSGYHRYGKAVCRLTNIPGPALNRFVLQAIKRVLLTDAGTTDHAIDVLLKSVIDVAPQHTKGDQRELSLLNRRIKATVAMLADPKFDGLDELRATLAELKAKRDALAERLQPRAQPTAPAVSEKELRAWALDQFARLDDLANRQTVDLKDRQLVESFVDRIEVNPETKTGVAYLMADLESAYNRAPTLLSCGKGRGWGGERRGTWWMRSAHYHPLSQRDAHPHPRPLSRRGRGERELRQCRPETRTPPWGMAAAVLGAYAGIGGRIRKALRLRP